MYRLYKGSYPKTHWASNIDVNSIVKILNFGDCTTVAKVNPTDARYRLIVSVHRDINSQKGIVSTYNIAPTHPSFTRGLECITSMSNYIFERLAPHGILTQIYFAANNSMSEKDGVMVLGNADEPFMPHIHLVLRTPTTITLGSPNCLPPLGECIDLREGKVPWKNKEELLTFADYIRNIL